MKTSKMIKKIVMIAWTITTRAHKARNPPHHLRSLRNPLVIHQMAALSQFENLRDLNLARDLGDSLLVGRTKKLTRFIGHKTQMRRSKSPSSRKCTLRSGRR